jgi:DNA-binding transcriptional LysR family regulator
MNYTHLQSFIVVANEDSFSKAAQKLYISNSSLIQQINLLEKKIGAPLFYRHYKGVTLTEAGKAFYEGIKYAVDIMEQTLKKTRAASKGEKTLRLSLMTPSLSETLRRFELLYPEVQIHFIDIPYDGMEYGLQRLVKGELDLFECEYTAHIQEKNLGFQKTSETELCAFVSFRHRLAEKQHISFDDLNGEHVILHQSLTAVSEKLMLTEHWEFLNKENTTFSSVEVLNGAENGKVYLMEAEWVYRLCPFGIAIPIEPKVITKYGMTYKKDNELVQCFLKLLITLNPNSGNEETTMR